MGADSVAKSVAERFNNVARGFVWYCPDCGREFVNANGCEGDECPDCDVEMEQMTINDELQDGWFNDEIILSTDDPATVKDGSIMVGCGGPNVWVNSRSKKVEVYWWADYAEAPIDTDTADAIREVLQDVWDVRRCE